MKSFYCFLFLALNIYALSFGQSRKTVGVVLSGGGAKGLAHVGVLKCLEENQIPVDYIVGTSMGGIVGGLYAAGFNADEIDSLVRTEDFQSWAYGKISRNNRYLGVRKWNNASFLNFQVSLDSNFNASINSNLVNDAPLNLALASYFHRVIKAADYNFDSLSIPFRCVGADIFTQKPVVMKDGHISDAIRATMAVPLMFRAVKVKGQYLYDGGLYNNFPIDVMIDEFSPDVIIGVNVSTLKYDQYPEKEAEELIKGSLKYMIMDSSDPSRLENKDVLINVPIDHYSPLDFYKVDEFVKIGYQSAQEQLDSIKIKTFQQTRAKRDNRFHELTNFSQKNISAIEIEGLNKRQQRFVRNLLKTKKKENTSIKNVTKGYYMLNSDNFFKDLYPRVEHDTLDNYRFLFDMNPSRKLDVSLGGNLASRNISTVYADMQLNILDSWKYTLYTNFYAGNFYLSTNGLFRVFIPTDIPFYLEGSYIYNQWDYDIVKNVFSTQKMNPNLNQIDRYGELTLGFPVNQLSNLSFSAGYVNKDDAYFNTENFQTEDSQDITKFEGWTYTSRFFRSTLDRKQFASSGMEFELSAKFVSGQETLRPGSTSVYNQKLTEQRDWYVFTLKYEQYFGKKLKHGILLEALTSNQPFFQNYQASMINAPAFYPFIDSKSLFSEDFRGYDYLALGLRQIWQLSKSLDFRLEGYGFASAKTLKERIDQTAYLSTQNNSLDYAAAAIAVYHSPFGPMSAMVNYYSDPEFRWGFMLNAGFLLYNKKAIQD
ncbi:patatin-like phospholipase family protein [Rapidithrix thailandica]|uniref:Patatin-like phospholipase family protein n=1 Tax=Rapidithrix thailandica TaxID=413964 RepID=A0AAW9SD84_9BACT